LDAIVLAGASADAGMEPKNGYTSRAMVDIAGKTMLQRVVDALRGSGRIERVVVIGDAIADGADEVLPAAGSFLENIMLGVSRTRGPDRVLLASSDIPLLTAEAVSDFVTRAEQTGADFCYPIIPKLVCDSSYPCMKRTYLKTREGTFTGGNLVLVSPEFLSRNERTISEAYAARKSVLALAKMVGLAVLARALVAQLLIPGLLSVGDLERVAGKMLNGKVKAIITSYPEIGEDVDKAADLEQVKRIVETGTVLRGSDTKERAC